MEEIASEFIVGTCQLLPKSYDAVSDRIHIPFATPYVGSKTYAIYCGSSAEFHIRPVNLLIDDVDRLSWNNDILAFIEDFPVLPKNVSRLNDTIKCYVIESYLDYPGFVRLRGCGKLNYNWKCKKYSFNNPINQNEYTRFYLDTISASWSLKHVVRGPSITKVDRHDFKRDEVMSVWCPQWPREAQGWPKRHRVYGWPTDDTIFDVVQQGCHVVYVQHRACRNDELQWRLSFSVAEIILLQSWTQVQQIVYHMLRFFSKRELIQEDCPKEDEVLCTYHLKTLMLWTCEEMSPEWWKSCPIITICGEMLQKLLEWLKRRYCPNYFIPEANLFHDSSNSSLLDKVERRLNEYRRNGEVCRWFLKNYIHPIIDVCETTKIKLNLVECMQYIIDFREQTKNNSLNILLECELKSYNSHLIDPITRYRHSSCLDAMHSLREYRMQRHGSMWILPLPENVSCFGYFDITLFSLHAMNGLCCGKMSLNDESFVEYIEGVCFKHKIIRCQYHNFPEPSTADKSQVPFLRAQNFAENITGLNSHSEFNLLSFMSKKMLRKALECDDSHSKVIAPPALTYLAALHFATSEYQTSIDLCSVVLMKQTTEVETETVNAGCLFFIDDVVRIVGFYLLCKKSRENMCFSKRKIFLDLRLRPMVFAYYLAVKSTAKISKQLAWNLYLPNSTFSFDQCLLFLTKRPLNTSKKSSIYLKSSSQCMPLRSGTLNFMAIETLRMDSVTAEEMLVEELTEYAFENMALFYSALRKHFGIQGSTVDCYRALYLYKHRKYDLMVPLCERILQTPGLESDLKEFIFSNVLFLPQFDSFFDEDVRSLLGFNTLYCYLSPLKDDSWVDDFSGEYFCRFVFSEDDPLSSSFGVYNPFKCHYFVGRHFLARYLKVRCCKACNQPCAKAMAEFSATKIIFPLEHIIRRFVLRKLGAYLR